MHLDLGVIMKHALAFSLCFFAAATALADQASDLDKMLEEMRDRALRERDVVALADYALKDFAEAQGYVDACGLQDNSQEIREMAGRFGEWAKPGFWSWLTGEQADVADSAHSFASLRYSTAKLSAIQEGCPSIAISIQRMAADTHKKIFDRYLDMQP